jgi:hypothetical protein
MAFDEYDIYLSYAPEDAGRAAKIGEELEWLGLRVWYRNQAANASESLTNIRQFLKPFNCQVVIWSDNSVASGRVQAEARVGSAQGRLIAVRIDPKVMPPLGTDAVAYADMSDWQGGTDHRGMKKLLGGIWKLTGKGQQPVETEEAFPNSGSTNAYESTAVQDDHLTQDEKDQQAWRTCLNFNTKTYYEHYLRYFPNGRHVAEAKERIAKKRRTTNTIIACVVIYVIFQIIFGVVMEMSKY